MAESQHCEDERQALLDKDAPSMAKYNSRVGRARMANQNARNQAHASHSREPAATQPTASTDQPELRLSSSIESDASYTLQGIVWSVMILPHRGSLASELQPRPYTHPTQSLTRLLTLAHTTLRMPPVRREWASPRSRLRLN